MKTKLAQAMGLTAALLAASAYAQNIKVAQVVELSGGGTAAGTMYRNGAKLAINEINAAGGVMGKKIESIEMDTQSQPAIAKAMTVKAIDEKVTAIFGPVFSGSILVSQTESQKANIPNFTGGEASNVTAQGNPYIFRSSFNQAMGMPKVAAYMAAELKAKSVAVVFVNNDFGKGGRDAIVKELGARNVKVAADISTDPGQVDMSSAVLRAKQANADALFAYLNEEESARLLKELRKQGYDKPLVGETTLMGAKVKLGLDYKFNENVSLSEGIEVFDPVYNFASGEVAVQDLLLTNSIGITAKLSDKFSLKVSDAITFDNVPAAVTLPDGTAAERRKLDNTTMATFVATLF